MKNSFWILAALTSLILIIGFACSKPGEAKQSFNNGDFKLELLFVQDGCKVYRFYDGSRAVYWSNCEGGLQTQTYHSKGYYTYMTSLTNKKDDKAE